MAARVSQRNKNLAKEMWASADTLNEFGRDLYDGREPTEEQLRIVEDKLFGALLVARKIRHDKVSPVRAREGQQT